MKKGDKVRFLNEKGGGIITGFSGKDIVLVEDQDGFEIPFRMNEVVVIESNSYGSDRLAALTMKPIITDKGETIINTDQRSIKSMLKEGQDDTPFNMGDGDERFDILDDTREVTFHAPIEEREGGNLLTAYVAFVPSNPTLPVDTTFDVYLVNDCNYFLQLSYMIGENNSWTLVYQGELAPNTKNFVTTLGYANLNELSHLAIQGIAYKREKNFLVKPMFSAHIKFEAVKFYKQSTFQSNDFFESPALLYGIIVNDEPRRVLQVDVAQLAKEMQSKPHDNMKVVPTKIDFAQRGDEPVVIDLHIDALLDNTQGMTSKDILDYQLQVFKDTLEVYRKHRGKKIIFIHGKGEGVLRRALINALNYQYKKFTYQDASFREYGYGATQITIH